MKKYKCEKCNQFRAQGKFCLDCGTILKEIITDEVKFKKMQSSKDHTKKDMER